MTEQRFTFVVTGTDAPMPSWRFMATLGDYDLDCPCGYGANPAAAIIDWLEMWGDRL